jgi:putative ABC transport system permease protein
LPGDIVAGDGVTDPVTGKNWPANLFLVDHDYIKTMDMKIVAGREFSRDIVADSTEHFIINETAVRAYGFQSSERAVGRLLMWGEWGDNGKKRKGEIIGVVKDFHFKSLRDQLTPVVMTIYPKSFWKLTMRIKPDHVAETLAEVKSTFERLNTEQPFNYRFVDASFDAMYKSEHKLSSLFTIFSALAIVVACLGLFGLIEYSVNQRSKEISIRKVFGARVNSLIMILTRKYLVLILLAFIIVIPISYYVSKQWLDNFAYHITISPWMYAKACGLILTISLCTVAVRAFKAATNNPVESLRSE